MSVQTWTWILVGITFALYFGIAIWARAGSTKELNIKRNKKKYNYINVHIGKFNQVVPIINQILPDHYLKMNKTNLMFLSIVTML